MDKLTEIKQEFKEAKELLLETLPASLAELIITKEELEEYQEKLKEEYPEAWESIYAQEAKTLHIRKKLTYLVNDYNLFQQIKVAVEVLDEAIEYHTDKETEAS